MYLQNHITFRLSGSWTQNILNYDQSEYSQMTHWIDRLKDVGSIHCIASTCSFNVYSNGTYVKKNSTCILYVFGKN